MSASSSVPVRRLAGGAVAVLVSLALVAWVTVSAVRRPDRGSPSAEHPGSDRPVIVVGTSMIECAARALVGDHVEVHRLAPPGQCPGHFDMKPGDLAAIGRCRLLVRHDYQQHIDRKLGATAAAPVMVALPTEGPQTLPANYGRLCVLLASALSEHFPTLSEEIERNLGAVQADLAALAQTAREDTRPLAGGIVVASQFQKEFCEWCGLRVAAGFDQAEEMSVRDLKDCMQAGREAGAVAVVGNLQRGEREGRPIADRLDVPLVLLSNFPLDPGAPHAYPRLVQDNIRKLLEACTGAADR